MADEYLAVVWIDTCRLIIYISSRLIIAINTRDVIVPVTDFTDETTVHIIEIEVHVTVAVAWKQNAVLPDSDAFHGLFFHVFISLFLDK